jgi:hypothetical protein
LIDGTEYALSLVRFSNIGPSRERYQNMFNDDAVDGLVSVLARLARDSGHAEIAQSPLLLWAHSAAGSFVSRFAVSQPKRLIGFVLYHSGGGGPDQARSLVGFPALVMKGAKDTTGPNYPEDFWRAGRSVGAPWTFCIEPDAPHASAEYLHKVDDLAVSWIKAVLDQRLPNRTGAELRPISGEAGWLANTTTGEVMPSSSVARANTGASWLPDEPSARGWQALCAGAN